MFSKSPFAKANQSNSSSTSSFGRVVSTPYDTPGRQPLHAPSSKVLRIASSASNELALSNCIAVSSQEFRSDQYVIVDDQFVLTTKAVDLVPSGTAGASGAQREWAGWSLNQEVTVASFDPFAFGSQVYIGGIDLEIGFNSRNKISDYQYDQDELAKWFISCYKDQIFSPGQRVIMDYKAMLFKIIVRSIQLVDLGEKPTSAPVASHPYVRGILTPHAQITFYKASDSPIKLRASSKRPAANAIIQPNFKFEDMGIGGLDNEFSAIFRRAFASRIFPPGLVEKLGIQHVKGILLYGPPGTGKTLMARQIGKMLNAREPKIVNGPEILSKFVGQSEENVRKLFADAEKEYKEKGEESGLHIIIFDELDAICKQRGSRNDSTGVSDSVVNQLLSKMDGVDQLNNILIIGMTNRIDMIDEALLRPGRLEVHMEVSLPDEAGRKQILKIHTTKMRTNKVMATDVNLDELAALTKNFSGAELNGLVKSATSFAFNRHVKVGTVAGVSSDIDKLKVNRQDFMNALDEVRPAFGINEEELATCIQNGIIKYSTHIDSILAEGKLFTEQVRKSEHTPLVSVLLHGPPGAGKTALAASIAMASDFPFIKLISPENFVGYNEASKVASITKTFDDAYKSPLNVVVVDNIERLVDWVPIGPRFSNAVLQTLMVLMRKQPPKGRRLLILATTTERSVLQQMDILDTFDAQIGVPNVSNIAELGYILSEAEIYGKDKTKTHDGQVRIQQILSTLSEQTHTDDIGTGVKKILLNVETAKQDESFDNRFAELMIRSVNDRVRL
ncbi:P-loop containing nucleoside triphosphate hydrolase protein [Lipomyces japonicus]|uniref:P-loop containing nucleoside triphosphate hydrolase protein n=1 Tax=Lipomyces japonicus TaxID=56871 RepID=UPI0034CF1EB2